MLPVAVPMIDNAYMAELKTRPTADSARDHVDTISDPERRRDCLELMAMMSEVSGEPPVLWGGSIVGFGSYRYRYASGRTGKWFRVGFASRKRALTLYLTSNLDDWVQHLDALGPHRRGKGCLYVRRLSDLRRGQLRRLIAEACREKSSVPE